MHDKEHRATMRKNKSEESVVRDRLARERTSLANERTLLAYLRTALMLLASGITLIKVFGSDRVLQLLGCVLVPLSVATALAGYVRFAGMRRRIAISRSREVQGPR